MMKTDDVLRSMTIADVNDQAKSEERAMLRSEENAEAWRNELHRMLTDTKDLAAGIKAEYTPLLKQARIEQDHRGYRQLIHEQRERLIAIEAHKSRLASRYQEAIELCKGIKAERRLQAREHQGERKQRRTNKATQYGKLLSDLRENLLDIDEFFTDAGQPMRRRFIERIEDAFGDGA